ncbi:hypothetical protein SAMN06272765_4199 [Streptomyces sp. Ag109_G2-15]|nr:hypothetical protein SAMN06272765_4199 [Streptomyces sp. Ag109_G2-15]
MTGLRLVLRLLAALLSLAVVSGVYLIVLTRGSILP